MHCMPSHNACAHAMRAGVHARKQVVTPAHTRASRHTRTHNTMHTCMHTCPPTRTHAHTRARAHAHTPRWMAPMSHACTLLRTLPCCACFSWIPARMVPHLLNIRSPTFLTYGPPAAQHTVAHLPRTCSRTEATLKNKGGRLVKISVGTPVCQAKGRISEPVSAWCRAAREGEGLVD